MIRLLCSKAKQLVVLLSFAQTRNPFPPSREIIDTIMQGRDEHLAAMAYRSDPLDPQMLIEELKTLIARSADGDDSRIIDVIVGILTQHHARNRMGTEMIAAMRRAILMPEELAKLDQIRHEEMICAQCEKPLSQGEVCCFYRRNDATALLCVRCMQPSSKPCASCNLEHLPFQVRLTPCRACKELEAAAAQGQGRAVVAGDGLPVAGDVPGAVDFAALLRADRARPPRPVRPDEMNPDIAQQMRQAVARQAPRPVLNENWQIFRNEARRIDMAPPLEPVEFDPAPREER